MDAPHIHLLINHIPILGALFGFLLLIVGMTIKNRSVEITALATILLAALFTIPAYLSGEEAEHVVEHIQGISEFQLEEHEEHAELSLWMMIASGVSALFALVAYAYKPSFIKILRISTIVLTGIGFATLVPLANHGGKIVHSELRDDSVQLHDQEANSSDHDDSNQDN